MTRNSTLLFLLAMALIGCDDTGDKDASGSDSDIEADTDTDTDADTDTDTDTDIVVPGAPLAVDDQEACDEGGDALIDVLINDVDAEGDIDIATVAVVDQPLFGSVTSRPDGTMGYRNDGAEDAVDSFTYTVSDAAGNTSNVATVTVSINPVNDPPTAVDDAAVADEGGAVLIEVALNDTDPDDGVDLLSAQIANPPSNGTATVQLDGTIDYVHDGSENPTDSFSYTIGDFAGATSQPARVEVTFNPINDAPTAIDDNGYAPPSGLGTVYVLNNDNDPDDFLDPASVVIITQPLYGILAVQVDGTVDYSHDGSLNYVDSFSYTVQDTSGAVSNEATVSMLITDLVQTVLELTPADGNLIQTDDPYWANKGYEFTALQDFHIIGGAWWIQLPAGGYVSLSIYDQVGTLLARGTQGFGQGLGIEEWYQSDLEFDFVAGTIYTASFYTDRAASSIFDRQDGPTYGYAVNGLIDNVTHRSSGVSGDFASEEWPDYLGNTWAPHQRLDVLGPP